MIIYKITNLINGKVYIGQTVYSLSYRKRQHLRCARNGDNRHLYNAMRKYGEKNFKFEIIATAESQEDLDYLEKYYIAKYDSVNSGYNMTFGGETNPMFCDITKRKHLDSMRSDSTRYKISNTLKQYRKNHPFTDEHRRKLSEKAMGNHNFGNSDTRSIGCWCIDEFGKEHHFHSYRDAFKWWKMVHNPFDCVAECVFQRKIKQSIQFGYYTYKHKKYTLPVWYKE